MLYIYDGGFEYGTIFCSRSQNLDYPNFSEVACIKNLSRISKSYSFEITHTLFSNRVPASSDLIDIINLSERVFLVFTALEFS